ncbi:MAG: fatty acid--CoA ligase family protein [Bacteroidia bacterium]|jgi:acyl-CoA synthetase (AMP-forming)/AMP-acid ligase II|nr:fatty acid--CoA ligase family protein [Bacteroidia bacterium]
MNSLSNIDFLLEEFSNYGNQTAIIWKDQSVTYSHILERIKFWSEKYHSRYSYRIVGLESDFSPETIAMLFALIEANAVVVPFDILHSEKNQKKYSIAQLDALIRIKDENKPEFIEFSPTESKNPLYMPILSNSKPGLVLFTSGSSGEPKGALHDFQKLLNKFKVKRKALRTVNFLLFDHWGGLNTLFHILSNGGTVVILENRSPDYVCQTIEKHQVELLPTSPTFLNMLVLSRAYERFSLKSLKLISYGAEPMPESLLKRINTLFPDIKLQQTYGLIELGVLRSQSEENGSLWVKIGGEGYQTRVVDHLLQIKSDSAMLGYLNAPSPFTEDGWFMTGDTVEVKGEYMKILGRKSEIINVGGEKVFPQEVENVILEIPDVEDVLVYSESNPLTGKIVCAKIKYKGNESKAELVKKVKTYCRTKLEPFKIPVKIELADQSFESGRFKKSRVSGN